MDKAKYMRLIESEFKKSKIKDASFIRDFNNHIKRECDETFSFNQICERFGTPEDVVESYTESFDQSYLQPSKLRPLTQNRILLISSCLFLIVCLFYTKNYSEGKRHYINREQVLTQGE